MQGIKSQSVSRRPTRSVSGFRLNPQSYSPKGSIPDRDALLQMAGGLAHNYNNLHTVMVLGIELARGSLQSGHAAGPLLAEVTGALARAADVTRHLMAYAGIAPFISAHVDLANLLRTLVGSIHPPPGGRIQIRLQLPADVPTIIADPNQIHQLLKALILNGIEAIGEAAIGTVTVRTYAAPARRCIRHAGRGGYVHIAVTDTGCGMDDSTRQRIFEPFFSTKFLGRGLGLAAAAGIVRSHQGTIEVRSQPGSGSTFDVALPERLPETKGVNRGDKVTKILIVDDQQRFRRVLALALGAEGFDVTEAANGAEGLSLAQAKSQDLILLDWLMPGMDGIEFCRAIRETSDIPIIMATSKRDGRAEALAAGASDYITKPFAIDELLTHIESLL